MLLEITIAALFAKLCRTPLQGPPYEVIASEKAYTGYIGNNFLLEIANPTFNPHKSIGNSGPDRMWLFLAECSKDYKGLYSTKQDIPSQMKD